ncbi:MAG: hypothetical protein JEZ00_19635 [Anaerolineaceae bacterium]|nr:hypothetical protein [Anaerolineaceae bacterium]
MELIQALNDFPDIKIFRIESDNDELAKWDVEPIDSPILLESDDYYLVKAKNILPDGKVINCYMDICLPERINDCAYFFDGEGIEKNYSYDVEGEVICAVPIDCFGIYELFYSKVNPEVGIDVLKAGLLVSQQKHIIAEDIGYILRDEGRFTEAAEMFQISVDEGPSSYFIFGELAECYQEIGEICL